MQLKSKAPLPKEFGERIVEVYAGSDKVTKMSERCSFLLSVIGVTMNVLTGKPGGVKAAREYAKITFGMKEDLYPMSLFEHFNDKEQETPASASVAKGGAPPHVAVAVESPEGDGAHKQFRRRSA